MIPYAQLRLEERTSPTAVGRVWDLLRPPYAVSTFTANVAALTANQIAGAGQYDDVEDTITLDVVGDLPATCANAYHELIAALDQARRWYDGDNVNPIVIVAELQCSTVGEVEAIILGPGDNQPPGSATPEATVSGDPWIIPDVTLTFRRRALWLEPLADAETATQVTSVGNPTIVTMAFPSDQGDVIAPAAVWARRQPDQLNAPILTCIIVGDTATSSAKRNIAILDATTWAGGSSPASYSSVNDAAKFPYNGTNILRFTPPDTAAYATRIVELTTLDGGRLIAGFAMVRNNSATTAFQIRMRIQQRVNPTTFVNTYARPVIVPAGIGNPYLLPLGIVPASFFDFSTSPPQPRARVSLEITGLAASGTLDISHVIFVNLDRPPVSIIEIGEGDTPQRNFHARSASYGYDRQSVVAGTGTPYDTRPGDFAYIGSLSTPVYIGNAEIGSAGSAAVVVVNGATAPNWTMTSAFAKTNVVYDMSRRRAYRTPQ